MKKKSAKKIYEKLFGIRLLSKFLVDSVVFASTKMQKQNIQGYMSKPDDLP